MNNWANLPPQQRLRRPLLGQEPRDVLPDLPPRAGGDWIFAVPSPFSLDIKRVVVELRDQTDPERGAYTLNR